MPDTRPAFARSDLVSVIIPSHNRPALLQRAIDSVSAQSHSAIEIVVFDNCSDPPILHGDLRSRFPLKIMRSSAFEPRPVAVNRAVDMCDGAFVCYLDDDDEYKPSKVESELQILGQRPEIDVVYGNIEHRFADGSHMVAGGPAVLREYLRWRYIHGNAIMLRRAVLERLRFDERMTTYEDVAFIGQALRVCRVHHIDEVHALWYRDRRPDQLTNRNWRRSHENWKRLCETFTEEIVGDRALRIFYYRKLLLLSLMFCDFSSAWLALRRLIAQPARASAGRA